MVHSSVVATLLALASGAQISGTSKNLRPGVAEDSLVEPIRFNQQLLVCNAYPSKSPIAVTGNAHENLAEGNDAIPFRECRYLKGNVEKRDQLDFALQDLEMHGTFEVGDLPSSDAILLLVIEKRPNSPMVSFQSFAFASSSERKEAQIAVINALEGSSAVPKLTMEDHIEAKEQQTVSKRVEQLSFNRVYSVEEGNYDASVSEGAKQMLKLAKGNNYVVLRTGGNGFDESLLVFPKEVPAQSPPKSLLAWMKDLAHTEFARVFGK